MNHVISGRTGLLALFGTPVGHSGSPAMYNFSFAHHNLDYVYLAFAVDTDRMREALDAVRLLKMPGCNVTMPCKNIASELVDELSPAARIIGSVNTVVNDNGKLVGHVTDGVGFVRSLAEEGVDVAGKKLVVIGAGGAGTALQVQCALDGAGGMSIFNISDAFLERARGTAAKLAKEAPGCRVDVYPQEDEARLKAEIASADILVNATRIGMKPDDDKSPVDKAWLRPELVVTDTVYNPEWTTLLKDAKAAGCKTVPGTGMLLWQADAAFKLFTGLDMPTREYKEFQAGQRK